tara:strand:+ start:177 stop:473 length:297 start_codon:yes stop_codon:yes gene_type:complete
MAAEIHQLPRFEGERPRRLPASGEEVPYTDALRILSERANEWRDRIQAVLDDGPHFVREDGRDHIMMDGATLQAMGEDMQALAKHLRQMASLIDEDQK